MIRILICLVAYSLCSCSRRTTGTAEPRSATFMQDSVSVLALVKDVVAWESRDGHKTFALNVRIWNRSNRTLFKRRCTFRVDRLIDGLWTPVQTPVCLDGLSEWETIAKGDSTDHLVRAYKFPDPRHFYGDPRLVEGWYRIVFTMGYSYRPDAGLSLVVPEALSATQAFVVAAP